MIIIASARLCCRLSYVFGLQGPCFSIDSACSSSLVAAHYGSLHLKRDGANASLVAGTNLTLNATNTASLNVNGTLLVEECLHERCLFTMQ